MIAVLLYGLFSVWFAWLNAKWIKEGKKIRHGWNGLLHIVAAGVIFYFFGWNMGLATLFISRLVFDSALNFFRNLPFDYIPLKPKSIVDRIEKWIFHGNIVIARIVYALVIVILFTL